MRAGRLRLPNLTAAEPDADLLRRFARGRDEAAFAELVRRHGPLVLAVCRRIVTDSHLADDAFQATFVVLARKADTIRDCQLSTWLHSVALKVSLRGRTMAGRRAKREHLTATVPDRPTPESCGTGGDCGTGFQAGEDATALDEEIARLPERLRAAVVLCELRGESRRDAAKELGITEGTLSSRLAAARKRLAERLRARGLAPAVGGVSAALVPAELAAAAVAAAVGKAVLGPQLLQLVNGRMTMALEFKLKMAAVGVLLAVLAVGGLGGRWENESVAAPVPKDLADAGVIWIFHPAAGHLVGYSPDGKKARTVKLAAGLNPQLFLGITRDGQHALIAADKGKAPAGKAGHDALHAGKLTVHLWPLHTDAKPTDTGIGCQYWSRYVLGRDGRTLIVEHDRSPRDPRGVPEHPIKYETVAYDLTTFQGSKRPALEKGFWLADELANGDRILSFGQYGSDKRPLQSFHLLPAGSDEPKPITGGDETDYCALAPDGRRFLVTRQFPSKEKPTDSFHRMFVIDRVSGKAEPLAHRDTTLHAHGHWSPDGKQVVYEWLEEGPQPKERILVGDLRTLPISRAQIVVTDAIGKNEKVLLELDGCPETDPARAQSWHDSRPKLVGWFLAKRLAPVQLPPKPKLEGKIAVWQGDSVAVLSPDGKELSRHTDEEWGGEVASPFVRLSPDGARIAMAGPDPRNLNLGYARILSADGKKVRRSEPLFGAPWAAFWVAGDNQFGVNATLSNYLIPVDDGAVATAPGGGFDAILAAAPNGVQVAQHDPKKRTLRVGKPDADDKDCFFVAEKDVGGAVAGVSRDGRTLLLLAGAKVILLDPKTGDRETAAKRAGGCRAELASNGEAVVLAIRNEPAKAGEKPTFTLTVYDRATKETTVLVRESKTPIRAVDFWSPIRHTAPVPKAEKENALGLTASVTFEQKEIMLGEPMYFTFAVKNPTDAGWKYDQGGDYRNRLGRPNSFAVTVTDADGKPVPQPDAGMQMGGLSSGVKLPADGRAAFHPLFLPHWATFEKPGVYTVVVRRELTLVPLDADEPDKATPTPVTLAATAKITVTAPDAERVGTLIETLAKDMLDPTSETAEHARKKLLEIRDPRVIPHFIELGKKPHPSPRSAACDALGRFKTDEAFAAMKVLYATTGPDLKGSAINERLEVSSADGVRHSAIAAIAACGHPDALSFVWKAVGDGYDGVRMTVLHKAFEVKSPEARTVIAALTEDIDERVRNEAKRYADLLAKGKK